MTAYRCPEGHESTSGDYCDTCGAPIPAAGATPAAGAGGTGGTGDAAGGGTQPPPGGPTVAPAAPDSAQACPYCDSPNPAGALFCEACGYDFTTGTPPREEPAAAGGAVAGGAAADPGAAGGTTGGAASAAGGAAPAPTPPGAPVSPPTQEAWVVELWVDPAWHQAQESEHECPSPGPPVVVPLTLRSVLVGRHSTSRNIHPQVDVSSDVGVSRRQAQLTTDGQRWWVEDLGSSNGTYVGAASGPVPTDPLVPGQRRELDEDDRVYIGAWTRLVIRRALPGEV